MAFLQLQNIQSTLQKINKTRNKVIGKIVAGDEESIIIKTNGIIEQGSSSDKNSLCSLYTNNLGKGMNLFLLFPTMGRLDSLNLINDQSRKTTLNLKLKTTMGNNSTFPKNNHSNVQFRDIKEKEDLKNHD